MSAGRRRLPRRTRPRHRNRRHPLRSARRPTSDLRWGDTALTRAARRGLERRRGTHVPTSLVNIGKVTAVRERLLQRSAGILEQLADHHAGARSDGRSAVRARPRYRAGRSRSRRPSMPSASAAICEKIVIVPWPISVLADSTRTRPSACRFDGDDRGEVFLAGSGEAGAVHEGRESDAAPHVTGRVRSGEAGALLMKAREVERTREDRVHVDFVAHHLADRAGLPRLDEVAAPQFLWREAGGAPRHGPCGARARRCSAVRRSREMRRAAGRWSRPRVHGCGRSVRSRVRRRGSCRVRGRQATACSKRRRRSRSRCPSRVIRPSAESAVR